MDFKFKAKKALGYKYQKDQEIIFLDVDDEFLDNFSPLDGTLLIAQ